MQRVPIRNRIRSVVADVFRRRMIRAKDAFLESARKSCQQTQQQTLQRLLNLNSDSKFSVEHGLTSLDSVQAFRDRLPVTDYEYYRAAVEAMKRGDHSALLGSRNQLLMYAVTSGTTSASKLIPVTRRFVADYRRGWQHWGMGVFQSHPGLSLLRLVQITSSHDREQTDDGTPCGNISGLASSMQKKVVQKLYTIPLAVAELEDAALKRTVTATFALADPWIGMFITANPSTLLQLMEIANDASGSIVKAIFDGDLSHLGPQDALLDFLSQRLMSNRERAKQLESILESHGSFRPSDCWTKMECLGVWTGGSAAAYLPRLRDLFGPIPIRDHGLHASEGRMTIPFDDDSASGLLDIESHFFEFIPWSEHDVETPAVLQAHELEEGRDYLILLTTSSGFYRYNIRDVVRCTGFHGSTPLLRFLHKGAGISSITGEKITESQVVESVASAANRIGLNIGQFTLTPVWEQSPGYRLFFDVADANETPEELRSRLVSEVDSQLRERNCEYDEKRSTGRLGPVDCEQLPAEFWRRFQRNRLCRSGGSPEQYKHPFLMPDSEFESRFLSTAEED